MADFLHVTKKIKSTGHRIISSQKMMTTKSSEKKIAKPLNARVQTICIVQAYQSLMIMTWSVQKDQRFNDVNVLPVQRRGFNKKIKRMKMMN